MRPGILWPLLAAATFLPALAGAALKFSVPPSVERFPDGAVEWSSAISCADPLALTGIRIVFSLDLDLDGLADGAADTLAPSFADCADGELGLLRTFFPPAPGVLTAQLRQGGVTVARSDHFTGAIGSLLAIRRYCARPKNGEPEWIEVRNASPARISLAKVRLVGYALGGGLNPGESLTAGKDSALLREWRPGAAIFQTSSWSYLRNTGDTLRVDWDNRVTLDSVIYGAARESREACASDGEEESVAAASGFGLEVPPRWNPGTGPLEIRVEAPGNGSYDVRVYDLDGFEICSPPARNRIGPAQLRLAASECPRLAFRAGTLLLQLRPRGSAPLRKLVHVAP